MTNKKILIIAEIGNNHEGSYKIAKEMIREAAKAKVDGVKFQIFETSLYISKSDKERYKTLKKFQLSKNEFINLSKYAKSLKLIFFATPFDIESAKFINNYQDIFKISSGDNNYLELIKKVSTFNKDIIISTGLSDIKNLKVINKEVKKIWNKNKFKNKLFFLHCVSEYPTAYEKANLKRIDVLKNKFPNIEIGYSDHTLGIECCKIAIVKGCAIIEKHFTLEKFKKNIFRDHKLSANEIELKELVNFKNIYLKAIKETIKTNLKNKKNIRRSFAVNKNLNKNTILSKNDLIFVRPMGEYYKNEDIKRLIGKKIKINLKEGMHIKKNHLY